MATRKQRKHDLLLTFYGATRKERQRPDSNRADGRFTRREVFLFVLELVGFAVGAVLAIYWGNGF